MSGAEALLVARADEELVAVAATEDGAIWFTLLASGRAGRRELDGTVAFLDLGPGATPVGVSAATESTVWVVDRSGDRLLHLGAGLRVLGEVQVPSRDARPLDVVTLPDGTSWFTEQFGGALGRIDILGRVEEYPVAGGDGAPAGIAASGDSLWFALREPDGIGHVRGGDAAIELTALPEGSGPFHVAIADDGAVWVSLHHGHAVARRDRHGALTIVPLPHGSLPQGVAARGDVAWIALSGTDALAEVSTAGEVRLHALPEGVVHPAGVAVAADGAVWVAAGSGHLVRAGS